MKEQPMKESELVANIAELAGVSQADAGRAVDAFVAIAAETLARGGDIRLTGFGCFEVVAQPARIGRHPRTGEEIAIAASRVLKFRPGALLKAAVTGASGTDPDD
jgi:DNA-binding protein HU-beta